MTQTDPNFKAHVYLDSLIKQKFNVFLEIYHDQFNPPIPNYRRKLIRARTTVMAFKSAEDAMLAHKNPGTITPVAIASSECSAEDVFVKRVGLQKSLHRLYRQLSANSK
jgi:hypothetical protein